MDERAFYKESQTTKPQTLNCPFCRGADTYDLKWLLRTKIDRLPGTRIVEQDQLTSQAFTDAQITSARALALLRQDDVGNFHAALRARELNPDIRLVLVSRFSFAL